MRDRVLFLPQLDNHVSTEVVDDDQWQPIHAAACWGHLEVVEMLAQNGANISAKTKNGETPFDICEDPEIKVSEYISHRHRKGSLITYVHARGK